jgi:type VI secretion system (T6SS) effector TldE1-like protein
VKPTKPRLAPAPQASAAKVAADPFGKVVADAKLSHDKLAAAFARARLANGQASDAKPAEVALAMPITERFHRAAPETRLKTAIANSNAAPQSDAAADPLSPLALGTIGLPDELAYASAEASPDSPVKLALASLALDPYGMGDDEPETDEDYMPDTVELPPARPETSPARPEAEAEAKPGRKPAQIADQPASPARRPAKPETQREPERQLAYARPDKPAIGAFKNLFNNTPKAGNRVAVYDISAAVVYMPDGSRLEAHSGIGKMADNPRYVHVKMNGPTPPNTYKLSMREKRFHGVEAVRMTPVGNQTMHGRDGILAHSYLLRGGREESHGCVAFANYPQFLKAFKQGKVTHIVVVPSMSGTSKVRLAAMGRGA